YILSAAILQGLKQQFRDALGCAHYVCRADSLIRRDQNKVFHAMFGSRNGQVICSEYVVLDGLKDMGFHQWDVFIGRGMINHRRLILAKDLVETCTTLDASYLGVKGNAGEYLAHFAINFEQRRFGNLETHNGGGTKTGYLSAKLRSNRTGRSRHK